MKIHQTADARVITLDPPERFTIDGPHPAGPWQTTAPLIVRTVTVFDAQGYFTLAGERRGVFEEMDRRFDDKGVLPLPVRGQLPNFELVDHAKGIDMPHFARGGRALYRG